MNVACIEDLTHAQLVEIVRALVLEPAYPAPIPRSAPAARRLPGSSAAYTGEVCIECGGANGRLLDLSRLRD